MIACAALDETNLVACKVASNLFNIPTTIARLRSADMKPGDPLLGREGFAVDHVICPEESVVRYIADDVMVMYFGEAVEYGPREEVFSNPQHNYTRTLFAATPRADVASIKARLAGKKAA